MPKTELSIIFLRKPLLWWYAYLISVHYLTPIPSPELETVITFHCLLSLQCLLIYQILPAWSQKCLWNLAISFISTVTIQAFISYLDHYSCSPRFQSFIHRIMDKIMPAELLSCKTNLIMLLSCFKHSFWLSFFL